MGLIYGNEILKEKFEEMEEEVTLEIYVSSDMKFPLNEDPVTLSIIVTDNKESSKIKLNITNSEGCSHASSTTGTSKSQHGPRVKYKDVNNRQGIPIQVRLNSDIVFFGADNLCKNSTPKEKEVYRSKNAKFAVKFVEDNKDKIIKLWSETDYDKAMKIINSMSSNKYNIIIKGGE